jgi:hypothetical protein
MRAISCRGATAAAGKRERCGRPGMMASKAIVDESVILEGIA